MLARVQSALLQGIDALSCEVEVDVDDVGLDSAAIVGLPDAAVRESSRGRLRGATSAVGSRRPCASTGRRTTRGSI